MYLREALASASDGDTLIDKCTRESFFKGVYGNINVSLTASISIEWVVIPVESKVLNASEIRTKVTHEDPHNTESYRKLMYACAEYGIENGQLKEWLRHKELRETVEDFNQQLIGFLSPSIVREYRDRFKALLDKLKEAK